MLPRESSGELSGLAETEAQAAWACVETVENGGRADRAALGSMRMRSSGAVPIPGDLSARFVAKSIADAMTLALTKRSSRGLTRRGSKC